MIDYLERLFAVERDADEELVERMNSAAFSVRQEETSPVLRAEREEIGQGSALSRRLDPLDPEELARVSMEREEVVTGRWDRVDLSRSEVPGGAQELERRLRRDSRRYDSGFFWF